MMKPQWLPENSISGCKQLIQEYWIRENALSQVNTNTLDNDNYTDQTSSNLDDSNLQPSNNQSSTSQLQQKVNDDFMFKLVK